MIIEHEKEQIECIRLKVISGAISVEGAHQELGALLDSIVLDISPIIEATMCNKKDRISNYLVKATDNVNCQIVKKLVASSLMKDLNSQKLSAKDIAFSLYLQLVDIHNNCWGDDYKQIIEISDGFELVEQGIESEGKYFVMLKNFLHQKMIT